MKHWPEIVVSIFKSGTDLTYTFRFNVGNFKQNVKVELMNKRGAKKIYSEILWNKFLITEFKFYLFVISLMLIYTRELIDVCTVGMF